MCATLYTYHILTQPILTQCLYTHCKFCTHRLSLSTLCVYYCICKKHITNGKMIFCLSASHICQQSVLIRRSHFSKCKYLLHVVTTDWVIRACIGGATGFWRMIDSPNQQRSMRSVKRCGEQAAFESHCSDIKRENHQRHTKREREWTERSAVTYTEVRL